MATKSGWVMLVAIAVGGCNNTIIDLSPDGGDTIVVPPPLCGNGVRDPGEECDDGDRLDGDGCTSSCKVGDGDPVGPADPEARVYVVEGPATVLPAEEFPPAAGNPSMILPVAVTSSGLMASWFRVESSLELPSTVSTRLIAADGTLVRPDVVVSASPGSPVDSLTSALSGDTVLHAWRTGSEGLWRADVDLRTGFAAHPSTLVASSIAEVPALAAVSDGYLLAWYEGTDAYPCQHDGSSPSRILLERLDANGATASSTEPVGLEDSDGAWTAPRLVASSVDSTVGLLWWRASDSGGECTLRFGVADEDLTTVLDGGAIGPGTFGSIATAEGAFQIAWRMVAEGGNAGVGVASFDAGAVLAGAPALHDMPFTVTYGMLALAAGDHGLLIVITGQDATGRPRLYFFRTDLLGRAVEDPFVLREVDPSCTWDLGCDPGPANVVWAGDAFVVVYFVTLDPTGPTPTTEMRMVRLVPEV
jgi:cysteine-rich repeat protein